MRHSIKTDRLSVPPSAFSQGHVCACLKMLRMLTSYPFSFPPTSRWSRIAAGGFPPYARASLAPFFFVPHYRSRPVSPEPCRFPGHQPESPLKFAIGQGRGRGSSRAMGVERWTGRGVGAAVVEAKGCFREAWMEDEGWVVRWPSACMASITGPKRST